MSPELIDQILRYIGWVPMERDEKNSPADTASSSSPSTPPRR